MDGNGQEMKPVEIVSWVKVSARADGALIVENPNTNMDNPKNIAAVIDLLAAGISSLCRFRLYKLGESSRIVPAGPRDVVKLRREGN